MPNIETYQNKQRAPEASSAGSEAFEIEGRHIEGSYAQAGNAIGRGINQVGNEIEQHDEIQETSNVSAQGAKAFADLSKDLSSTMTNADPNQADAVADKWREDMEDKIGKVGADMSTPAGREAASRIQNTLRNEFTTQSRAYQSTLSGQAVISNLLQTHNGLAQAVSNNPASLPGAIAYMDGAINDQLKTHSYLSPADVARVRADTDQAKKDLGVAAFHTMAAQNPGAAKDALKSGTFAGLFNGQEIDTLSNYADQQSKAQIEAKKAAENEQRRQESDAFKATTAQMSASMIRPDGSLTVPKDLPQAIIKASMMPGADSGTIRSMVDMVKTINKEAAAGAKAVTDPGTYTMFNQKLLSGQLTDADVYGARADGKLSDKDTSYFIRASKDLAADPAKRNAEKDFAAFTTGQKPAFTHGSGQISVDPSTGAITLGSSDPVGAQNYANFYRDAKQQYDAMYAKDPVAAAKMLDPGSPTYLGRIAPQYLKNKKSADFNTNVAPPVKLEANAIDSWVSDPANKGKSFIAPDGKTYKVP